MATWSQFQQDLTAAAAHRRGFGWTQSEIDRLGELRAAPHLTLVDAAIELNRTLYGVQSKAFQIDAGEPALSARIPAPRGEYRGWVEGMGDGLGRMAG